MAERSKYDFYPTPKEAFLALYEADKENWNDIHSILEPAAGDGNLINYISEVKSDVLMLATELDMDSHKESLINALNKFDAFVYELNNTDYLKYKPTLTPNLVITNPPFSIAQEFIEHTLEVIKPDRTIMLLRLNFLGSQKRKDFWRKHPPSKIYVLSKRPSFTGKGTDSTEYAWFVWDDKKYENAIEVI